jgi:hypothetical protein
MVFDLLPGCADPAVAADAAAQDDRFGGAPGHAPARHERGAARRAGRTYTTEPTRYPF